jgi:hypothetical protein
MMTQLLDDKLAPFYAVVTFSSVEHSGPGRYGDALNPFGDLQTMARSWCVSKPDAALVIGVMCQLKDVISFNAHRNYGPLMYSHLLANWNQVWKAPGGDQTVYALTKE